MKLLKISSLLILLLLLFISASLLNSGNSFANPNYTTLSSRTFCFQQSTSTTSWMCKANGFVSNIQCLGYQNATTGPCDFANPFGQWLLYTIMHDPPYTLYSADTTTGEITAVGNVAGIASGHLASGITWDNVLNTLYIESTNMTQSRLYTLNLSNLAASQVGSAITNAPALLAIDANPAGVIFGIDISNDNVYRINKNTGVASLVGPIGINMNFGIDSDFDARNGILYTYTEQLGMFWLRSVDTNTGMSTLVGNTPYLTGVTGITVSPGNLIGIGYNGNEIPEKFSLSQNYPNPFNPSTTITYGLPVSKLVLISIFDITGREVLKLYEGFKPSGIYSVLFDGSDFPSGVYFYKINAGEFTDTKKMVLIK